MEENIKGYSCPVCGWTDEEREDYTHCPHCLGGIHEVAEDGEECGGTLEPVSIWVQEDRSWKLIRRCMFCGDLVSDSIHKADNPVKLMSIASKPLAMPPFPIERMEMLTKMMGGQGDMRGYYGEERE